MKKGYKLIKTRDKVRFGGVLRRFLGIDLILGLGVTLRELFTPSTIVTIKYPQEKIPLSPRYRAVHKLMRLLDSGNERCIGCGLCEKICVSNCIKIETSYGDDGRRSIERYSINFGRCIYCGLCAEVCPELAIIHGDRYENVSEQRAHFSLKESMLTPIDLAKNGGVAEFSGVGSVSENLQVKQTPIGGIAELKDNEFETQEMAELDKFADSLVKSLQELQNGKSAVDCGEMGEK